jgi:hypothetical protein
MTSDFNPLAPINELPADIRRDIETERGWARPTSRDEKSLSPGEATITVHLEGASDVAARLRALAEMVLELATSTAAGMHEIAEALERPLDAAGKSEPEVEP